MPNLQGLYIKWGSVKDISSLAQLQKLQYLHIGSSPQLESIDSLREFIRLTVIELENIKKVRDLSPLQNLHQLEGLAVQGSTWTTQVVESLEPLQNLSSLRYLFLGNLRALNGTLEPLSHLQSLGNLQTAFWWRIVDQTS